MSVPRLATSRILPFCAFLCLLLLGCNMLVQFENLTILLSPSSASTSAISSSATGATAASSFTTAATVFTIPDLISPLPSVADICFTTDEIRIQISLGEYFTLANPNLHTDFSIYRQRKHAGIIDIHAERMQWCTTGFNFFRTGNFRTSQTTPYFYLDPFSTHADGRSNRH